MPLGNTSYLQIPLMAESDNQKYLLSNNAFQAIDDSLNRLLSLDFTGTNLTLTESQLTRYGSFRGFGNALPRTLTIPTTVGSGPAITTNRFFIFHNTGADAITLTHGAGLTVDVPTGTVTLVLCDGTDIVSVASASGFDMGVREEGGGDFVSNPTFLNYIGNNVTAALNGLGADVTVTMPEVQDETVSTQTDTTFFNFTGAGVVATANGNGVDITIPGGSAGLDVEEEGVGTVTAATVMNFIGANVTVTDNAGDADVTIQGAAVQDEGGAVQADPTFINFIGAGVVATLNGTGVDVTIAGGGGSGLDVEEEGVGTVTGATVMNFIGANVTVTDNAGDADVTIQGAAVQDEGAGVQTDPTFINFVGAGVTAAISGAGVTVTIPASAGTAIPVDDSGANIVAAADRFDFLGAGVSVAANGNTAEVTVAGNPLETQDDGVQAVAITDTINFTGAGVTTTNPSGNVTEVNIPGGGGGSVAVGDLLGVAKYTPVAGSWTAVNTGSPVESTQSGGKATIRHLGDQGHSQWYTTVTAATDFDVVFRARITCYDDTVVGMGFYAGSSAGLFPLTSVGYLFGNDMAFQRWNGTSFVSETTIEGSVSMPMLDKAEYWRITRVGSDLTYYVSESGLTWIEVHTETVGTHVLDVDRIGFLVNTLSVAGNHETHIIVDGYDATGPQGEQANGTRNLTLQEDTTTAYVVVNGDLDGNVFHEQNNAAANTVTVNNTLTGAEPLTVMQTGAGQTTFVAGAGVTINSAGGLLALSGQYSSGTLIPVGSNVYRLVGDLA